MGEIDILKSVDHYRLSTSRLASLRGSWRPSTATAYGLKSQPREVGCLQEVEAGLGRLRPHPIGMVSTRTHAPICRCLTVTMRNQPNVREGRLRNARRNHQGLANRVVSPQAPDSGKADWPAYCRQQLGGMNPRSNNEAGRRRCIIRVRNRSDRQSRRNRGRPCTVSRATSRRAGVTCFGFFPEERIRSASDCALRMQVRQDP